MCTHFSSTSFALGNNIVDSNVNMVLMKRLPVIITPIG